MFFLLSKTVGFLIQPHYLALLLLLLALALRLARRGPRLRRRLVLGVVVYLWLLSTGVVANLLLYPLESRYARPAALARPPAAIVMLTGCTDHQRRGSTYYELTDGADRIVEAVRLTHQHPGAVLLISGGSSELRDTSYREAETLGRLARELGLPAARVLVDRESRNTRENATESRKLLERAKIKGPVLLVTSALHMPRSVACFAKAGLAVIPWPVDFLRSGSGFGTAWLPKPWSLSRSTQALHEYVGWVFYRLAGYI